MKNQCTDSPVPAAEQDWEKFTPEMSLTGYQLVMWDDHNAEQEICLTREEFIDLKRHLAEERGLLRPNVYDARLDPSTVHLAAAEWKMLEEAAEKLRVILAAKAD